MYALMNRALPGQFILRKVQKRQLAAGGFR
jgi:hypothetical protein